MNWRDLFHWWNAIYSIPLLVALIYLGISLLLGTLLSGHEIHHDVGADADADAEAGVAGGVDHDIDHDIGHDVDHDAEGNAESPGDGIGQDLMGMLVFLGVGRAPMTLVLQCFLILWGVFGLVIHGMAGGGSPAWLALSLPISLVGSVTITRGLAFTFGKVFRRMERLAPARSEFIGRTGRVVFAVTPEEGTIHFRDESGALHRVRARSHSGTLDSGQEVIVLDYDPDQNVYTVDDAQRFAQ